MLLVRAEAMDLIDDGREQGLGREGAMTVQGVDQARFAKFFACRTEGFGDAVGVESEGIAGTKLEFGEGTIPISEDAHNGGGGPKAFEGVIGAQEKRGKVAAIGVAQTARGVVILREEEGGKGSVGSIGTEELVHGA